MDDSRGNGWLYCKRLLVIFNIIWKTTIGWTCLASFLAAVADGTGHNRKRTAGRTWEKIRCK